MALRRGPKRRWSRGLDAAASAGLRFGVAAYRVTLGPFLGGHCRFEPTCSQYALDAVAQRGPWVGACLAAWRVMRCQPFGGRGGFDPVPPRPGPGEVWASDSSRHDPPAAR